MVLLEVAKEGVEKQVEDDKGRKDSIDDGHENESTPESDAQTSLTLYRLCSSPYSPFNQLLSMPVGEKLPTDLALAVEEKTKEAKGQIPLE